MGEDVSSGPTTVPAPVPEPPPLRATLRRVVIAWMFGSAWMYLASGAAFTRYAKLLNVSHFGFGLLAAVPFIGAMVQLPTSMFLERYGHRKALFLWTNTIHRSLWLVIAAIPWILPPGVQWPVLIVLMLISALLANVATPAWMTWMADLVPQRIRGRYFSRRVQIGQAVGLALSMVSGLALDWPGSADPERLTAVISAMFAVAGACGVIDILIFSRVPDPHPQAHHRPRVGLVELVRRPMANPNFRRFLGYSATMTLATGYMAQFLWLYLFDVAGMNNTWANSLMISVPICVTMLTYPFWGRMVDRFGTKPVLLLAGILVVNGGTFWIFVTPTSWLPGYVFVLIATLAWPGMDLAAFNILLRMTGTGPRGLAGTTAVAINSLGVAIAGALSGLLGGSVAAWLGNDWRGSLFGWPLTYHGVLFLISAGLRATSLLWIVPIEEGRRMATRDALLYMANAAYSNLQLATGFSLRMLSSVVRLTWRLPRRGGPPLGRS